MDLQERTAQTQQPSMRTAEGGDGEAALLWLLTLSVSAIQRLSGG